MHRRSGYSIIALALWALHRFSHGQLANITDISTVKVNLVNDLAIDGQSVTEFICMGSLEIDILANNFLLVGLCTPPSLALSGAIGVLPYINNSIANQPLSESDVKVLYGNLTAAKPARATTQTGWDTGIGRGATIFQPEHLYQTGYIIYFVDSRTCLRKVNRRTGDVTTIIGICGSGTLGIVEASDFLVLGMTYIEEKNMFVFAIVNMGVYVFTSDGKYRKIVDKLDISSVVSDSVRFIVKGSGTGSQVIWHKIGKGINMYNLTDLNATDGELVYQQTFIRYISATGSATMIDTTALRHNESDPELGAYDAVLDVSPDGETLLIADMNLHQLSFLQLLTEVNFTVDKIAPLQAVCDREKDMSAISDNLGNCTFHGITSALWVDDYTILVFERYASSFRIVRLQEWTTTPTPTTTTTTPNDASSTGATVPWWSLPLYTICMMLAVAVAVAVAVAYLRKYYTKVRISTVDLELADTQTSHEQLEDLMPKQSRNPGDNMEKSQAGEEDEMTKQKSKKEGEGEGKGEGEGEGEREGEDETKQIKSTEICQALDD